MKSVLLAGLLAMLTVLAAGCNTVQGVGKDIKQGGEALEKAAKK
jgi:entericidin B